MFNIYKILYFQYMYTSLADYQIKKEETIQRNPLIMGNDDVEQTPAEVLYQVSDVFMS